MSKVLREIIIALILILIVIFIMIMLFYGTVSEQKVTSIDYNNQEVDSILNEIAEGNAEENAVETQNQVIKSYSIETEEEPVEETGKVDPFSETENTTKVSNLVDSTNDIRNTTVTSTNTTTNSTNTTNTNTNTNNSTNNNTTNNTTSQGRFFEEKDSK